MANNPWWSLIAGIGLGLALSWIICVRPKRSSEARVAGQESGAMLTRVKPAA
jgi:cyanate permease